MSKRAIGIAVFVSLVSTTAAAESWTTVGKGGLNIKAAQHQPPKIEVYHDDPPEPRVGEVTALAVYKDELYAGGEFDTAGGQAVSGIARWNGKAWSPVGDRFAGGGVRALLVYKDELYVAGHWKGAKHDYVHGLARWNGKEWSTVGTLTGGIEAMAIFQDRLVVGGLLSGLGGDKGVKVVAWDGKAWSAFPDVPNDPYALGVWKGELYAGGTFLDPAKPLPNLYRWNGKKWLGVASFGGAVSTLIADASSLYASGSFRDVGRKTTGAIARFDGKTWSSVGGGLAHPQGWSKDHVATLSLIDGVLYAGGDFRLKEGRSAVARWDGKAWTFLGEGLDGAIRAFAVYRGELFAGGRFLVAGGDPTLTPEYANIAHRKLP